MRRDRRRLQRALERLLHLDQAGAVLRGDDGFAKGVEGEPDLLGEGSDDADELFLEFGNGRVGVDAVVGYGGGDFRKGVDFDSSLRLLAFQHQGSPCL